MKKIIKIEVDTKIARRLLNVAGYSNLEEKTDDEVARMALEMCSEYGVTIISVI